MLSCSDEKGTLFSGNTSGERGDFGCCQIESGLRGVAVGERATGPPRGDGWGGMTARMCVYICLFACDVVGERATGTSSGDGWGGMTARMCVYICVFACDVVSERATVPPRGKDWDGMTVSVYLHMFIYSYIHMYA